VKHQVGFAWNEVSRRYVDDEPEFYLPTEWRMKAENKKQGSSDDYYFKQESGPGNSIKNDYDFKVNINTEEEPDIWNHSKLCNYAVFLYNSMIDEGIAPEMARMVLPQSMMTEWIWSGSLMAWARLCKLRLDPHAQAETAIVARRFDEEIKQLFPVSWGALMRGE
jgi:thymidylate synthase (FAD)